ncbi:aldo/keto reductase [Paenibacillus sp. MMS20-IR301]|uniref:aldo/keto reductase n=1 Tax=Paenibacillus sp. MMS20-IR301 TaxID=2895946 RepID=UPI0028ED8596|nr:aldo/keto reductase [Paenibacillus sp. MMS20-IR301]WNS45376.1 aldo/keto reductase [Paenibacillus sp. MMS20-IR301]
MKYRKLGNTGLTVSEVSFGTWAIGGDWGNSSDEDGLKGLQLAMEQGVNFFDTADVYGAGHAEELLAKATKGKHDEVHIATKFCRAGDIHDPDNYSARRISEYCEQSLRRLEREAIDLYQIHCPPIEILRDGSVFAALDQLKAEGKIRHYGVSVETIEEGLLCLDYPGVAALQIIFNLFRQQPALELLPRAATRGAGILVRLPLASGLLTGKFKESSTFQANDHRHFNANGEQFNVGETFSGLPFAEGVRLARQLEWIAGGRGNMARASMRWILDHPAVSCVIPGFKNEAQVADNLAASEVPAFSSTEMERLSGFYRSEVAPHIRGGV